MTHTILRTGTYTPQDGDHGPEFRTQFFPDGSAIIVNEKGIHFVSRRAPYFVSVACTGKDRLERSAEAAGTKHLKLAATSHLRLVSNNSFEKKGQ